METQIKIVTKEEAHRLIDAMPGNGVTVLAYNVNKGKSDNGKYVKKKKGKKMTDKASTLVLCINDPIMTLTLHNTIFTDFSIKQREHIVKSIMLANMASIKKLE